MPANTKLIRGLTYMLYIACAALLIADLLIPRQGYFSFESLPGFYIVFGFATYAAIVVMAKLLRMFVKRNEDYYD